MFEVSVIVLTLNSERHISRCLASMVDQTFKNFEVIIVDAGSNDRTLDIIESYKKRLSLQVLSAPKTSMGEARNVGIRHARGNILAYCDSDDRYLPEKLELQLGYYRSLKNKNVVVFSDILIEGSSSTLKFESPRYTRKFFQHGLIDVVRHQGCNLSSMLVPKNTKSTVYFNEGAAGRFGEDWQYNISLAVAGLNFKFFPGYYSIVEERSDSHSSWSNQHLLKWYVIEHLYKNKDLLLQMGVSKTRWCMAIFSHWVKFFVSCPVAGCVEFPLTQNYTSIGKKPWALQWYKLAIPIITVINKSGFFKYIWILKRKCSRKIT